MIYSQNKEMRFIYSLPVILVLTTIAGLYYCYLFGFLLLLETDSVVFSGIIFHFFLILLLWSYLKSIITDPGTIPESFHPVPELSETQSLNEEDLKNAKVSTCKICKHLRPPRTHHCQTCDRCVLRRDHHCPFISNCVGFYNHRFFIQFISYTSITSAILGSSCLVACVAEDWRSIQGIIGFVFGFLIFLGIGGFSLFHYYIAAVNLTSSEYQPFIKFNVFDVGNCKKNCQQIFGSNCLGFFLPVQTGYGIDPTVYPVRIRSRGGVVCYQDRVFN